MDWSTAFCEWRKCRRIPLRPRSPRRDKDQNRLPTAKRSGLLILLLCHNVIYMYKLVNWIGKGHVIVVKLFQFPFHPCNRLDFVVVMCLLSSYSMVKLAFFFQFRPLGSKKGSDVETNHRWHRHRIHSIFLFHIQRRRRRLCLQVRPSTRCLQSRGHKMEI